MNDVKKYKIPVLCFIVFLLPSCSVSYSVDKFSDSISESLDSISASFDSSGSISGSSGSDKEEVKAALLRFKEDIIGLTRVYARRSETARDFEYQIGTIAAGYGISDWEREQVTFLAIGIGLRESGMSKSAVFSTSFLQTAVMEQNRGLIFAGFYKA